MSNVLDDELSLEATKPERPAIDGNFNQNPNRVFTGIIKWYTDEVNVPEYFQFLTGLDKSLPLKEHRYTSHGIVPCLKSKIFGIGDSADCCYCKEDDAWSLKKETDPKKVKKNRARDIILLPAYFFSRVGKTVDVTFSDGTTKSFPDHPVKFIPILRGDKDANLGTLLELNKEGLLTTEMFSIQRHPKEAKKTPLPETASRSLVKSKFKDRPDVLKISKDIIEMFENASLREIRGLGLNTYVGASQGKGYDLDWDLVEKFALKPDKFAKQGTELDDSDDVSKDLDG